MSHPRSGQRVSTYSHNTEAARCDIELQEVAPFAAADSPPPLQTRPFTGFIDPHNCLLPHPQTRLSLPNSSRTTADSKNHQKRHSTGVPSQERGQGRTPAPQNPPRRHSSSSHKAKSGLSVFYPYTSGTMAEARNGQTSVVPAISVNDDHVPGHGDYGADKNVENTPRWMHEVEPSRQSVKLPVNGRSAELTPSILQATTHSASDDTTNKTGYKTGAGQASSDNTDKTDGLLRRKGNDYERLVRGSSSPQHVYGPIVENPDIRQVKADAATPNTPKYVWSGSGAKSPLYESRPADVHTEQVRPMSYPFLPPRRQQYADNADDIIELQSDVRTSTSTEERQNKSNIKKDVPEVNEVPNTNFAIACMVALCFNLPFGVLAMYFSLQAVKAFQDGRAKLGERRSRWSIVLSLLGITITTVIISSVVLYTALQGQKRISRHRTYGTKAGLNL